jgi:hypothetical protein
MTNLAKNAVLEFYVDVQILGKSTASTISHGCLLQLLVLYWFRMALFCGSYPLVDV